MICALPACAQLCSTSYQKELWYKAERLAPQWLMQVGGCVSPLFMLNYSCAKIPLRVSCGSLSPGDGWCGRQPWLLHGQELLGADDRREV